MSRVNYYYILYPLMKNKDGCEIARQEVAGGPNVRGESRAAGNSKVLLW